jgi:uncharacterized protein YebE (UPF0316 family)
VREIAEVQALGVQIGIVIGGGNIFRGVALGAAGMAAVLGGLPRGLRYLGFGNDDLAGLGVDGLKKVLAAVQMRPSGRTRTMQTSPFRPSRVM